MIMGEESLGDMRMQYLAPYSAKQNHQGLRSTNCFRVRHGREGGQIVLGASRWVDELPLSRGSVTQCIISTAQQTRFKVADTRSSFPTLRTQGIQLLETLLSGALYLHKTFPQKVGWQLGLDFLSQCFTLFTLLL